MLQVTKNNRFYKGDLCKKCGIEISVGSKTGYCRSCTPRKNSKEHNQKISDARKGNGNGMFGKIPWNKGKIFPEFSLENSNLWKGGITPLKKQIRNHSKYRQWRSDIYERDDYICQFCFNKGGILNADHIKPFSLILKENNIQSLYQALDCEELWNINNGRTLCFDCHKTTETFGGKKKCSN